MNSPISAYLEVAVFLRKEPRWWVAYCPALELASEGSTKGEAVRMFKEAISLYIASCEEAGTLADILQAALTPAAA